MRRAFVGILLVFGLVYLFLGREFLWLKKTVHIKTLPKYDTIQEYKNITFMTQEKQIQSKIEEADTIIKFVNFIPNKEKYSKDPINDIHSVTTKFHFINSLKSSYELGEQVQAQVQSVDGYGENKTEGGDYLVVVLSSEDGLHRAPGYFIDKENGVYIVVAIATSVGRHYLNVTLAYSREIIGTLFRLHRSSIATMIIFLGIFDNGYKQKEITPCHIIPDAVINYSQVVCNLTAENYGNPWFCAKPKNEKLLCLDWIAVGTIWTKLPVSEAEEVILNKLQKGNKYFLFSSSLTTMIEGMKPHIKTQQIPCHQQSWKETWTEKFPVGFIHNKTWITTGCKKIDFDKKHFAQCMKDKNFFLFGDSNARELFFVFNKYKQFTSEIDSWSDNYGWHRPRLYVNTTLNSTVYYAPPSHPMQLKGNVPTQFLKSLKVYLDMTPDNSNTIFLIHFYLHYLGFPPKFFEERMYRIKSAIEGALKRIKNARFAIIGTHFFFSRKHYIRCSAIYGPLYQNIIRKMFKGLEDKVLYLQVWDMSLLGSYKPHPDSELRSMCLNHLLSYFCD